MTITNPFDTDWLDIQKQLTGCSIRQGNDKQIYLVANRSDFNFDASSAIIEPHKNGLYRIVTLLTPAASSNVLLPTSELSWYKAASTFANQFETCKSWRETLKLEIDGDRREQQFVALKLSKNFPNYERMWNLLVVPASERISTYPHPPHVSIRLSNSVSADVARLCQYHYSVAASLVHAKNHLNRATDCDFQDFFVHLMNCCERVQLFLFAWLVAVEKSHTWSDLTNDKKKFRKEEWREETLSQAFSSYKSQMDDFRKAHTQAKTARNILVHGPELPEFGNDPETAKQLRIQYIHQYYEWFEAFGLKETKVTSLFNDSKKEMRQNLTKVLDSVNFLWGALYLSLEDKLKANTFSWHNQSDMQSETSGNLTDV